VEGPKFLYDQTSKVYAMDAGAYYDPTLEDKNARMKYLQERIDALTEQMKLNFKPLKIETRPVTIAVQNFQNKNKEETNGFIARSYYYPVGDSPKSVVDAPKGVYSPKEAERKAPVQAKQVKPVELPGLKNIPAKEVSRDQLVQQKEATATNDANDVAKRVTSNTELKGYKTVATNAPKVAAVKSFPSAYATVAKREEPVNMIPQKSNLKTVKPEEVKRIEPVKAKVEEKKVEKKDEEKKVEKVEPVKAKVEAKVEVKKAEPVKAKVEEKVEKVESVKAKVEAKKVEPVKAKRAEDPMFAEALAGLASIPIKHRKNEETKKVEEPKAKVEEPKKKEVANKVVSKSKDIEPVLADNPNKNKKEAKKVENVEAKSEAKTEVKAETKAEETKAAPQKFHTQGFRYETIKIVQK